MLKEAGSSDTTPSWPGERGGGDGLEPEFDWGLFNPRCGYAAFKGESFTIVDGSLKNVHLQVGVGGVGAIVWDYCQGSTDVFLGGPRPLFSLLLSFDGCFEVNFKVLLGEAPALAVVLCDEQVQMDISAGF